MAKRKPPSPPVTKLAPPVSQALLLPRPDILAALCGLADAKLAVVTAPTGAGKSTLLSQAYVALAAQGMDVCWLSLDGGDNSPQRFVAHLVAAVQRARPDAGADALDLLGSPVAIEDVLAALINDLTISDRTLALFLDDYQIIDNPDSHAALGYFLHYSPASVRIAVASQQALPLPVARLKARNLVIELGFDALRFRPEEIRAYLAQSARVAFTEEQVRRVSEQTEGWVCALQLAALAVDARAGLPASDGGGAHGYADALLSGVLARQAPEVQEFLLATSVLAQFSAPLAEAVTGQRDCARMIESLEEANLFVVRLDGAREWFRYHHLFSGLLRKRLAQTAPERAAQLNRRAACWCAAHGQSAEALGYALAADDVPLAVSLLEVYGRALIKSGSFKELDERLQALPPSALRASAALCVQEAWARLYLGEAVAAGEAIRAGEAALARPAMAGARGSAHGLRHELQIQRTMYGVTRYDLPDVAGLTPDLPDAFGAEDPLSRAYAHVVLGYAARLAGRLAEARSHYEEAMRISDLSEDIVVNLMARYNIAMVHNLEARPDLAAAGLGLWIRDARNKRWQRSGSAAFLKAAHAIVLLDMDRPADALADISEAIEVLDVTRTYAYVGIALSVRAQILAALGNTAAALEDLRRAREVGRQQGLERVTFRAILAEVRILCGTGALARAREMLDQAHAILEATGQTRMALPSENCAMFDAATAAWLRADGRHAELAAHAWRAIDVACRAGRTRHEIEFLVWRAVGLEGMGDGAAAAAPAARAIDLASVAGVVQPFLAAGAAVLPLISVPRAGGLRTTFAARVAASFERKVPAEPQAPKRAPALHQREVQILQLIGQGLRNREIGERLLVSEETVKWYLKKIYETLAVGNRTHALVRARELGVIA